MFSSALPNSIRCPADCGRTLAAVRGPEHADDITVTWLRRNGWQVVDGAWTCADHLPEDRQDLPGAMGRHPNPHCSNCGDTRGGPFGHEAYECTWKATA
ncbi:MAG: hypothetical protein ABW022_08445 [Actinoplanes sp.]